MKKFLTIFVFLALMVSLRPAMAQTDTEFWLSIPEINRYHNPDGNVQPGKPMYIHITSRNLASEVTVSMPRFGASFEPVVINLPPNTTYKLDISPWITDNVADAGSIENTLYHTVSNTVATQPYINRSDKGVLIRSTTPITAYLEISVLYNRELIALKGRNALGRKFYIPFQTRYGIYNYGNALPYRPHSSFDIVASADDTRIRITPTQDVWVANDFLGGTVTKPANVPFDIWLNRGQVAVITPYQEANLAYYQTSFTRRLAGSKVEVLSGDSTTHKIAIITREDLVRPIESYASNDVDYIADQIVPVDLLGTHYAIIRGMTENNFEHAYVVGTEDNTTYSVNGGPDIPINEMESQSINIPYDQHITTITSSHPIYVYHAASADRESQLGGSIIPTISYCTGSSRVAFNRTSAAEYNGYFELVINVLVRRGAEGSFVLLDEDENDVTALVPGLANPASFIQVPGAWPYTDWLYARFSANNLDTDVAYQLMNTRDVFHLGLLNGYRDGDNFYGYFSDFNAVDVNANIAGFGGNYVACFGEPVQLVSDGGVNFSWYPPDYLDDPTSATPVAMPEHSIKYTVTVSGACQMVDSADVFIYVSDPVHAIYTLEENVGCSPFLLEVNNESIGVQYYNWNMGDGTAPYTWAPDAFEYLYINETDEVQEFDFRLVGRSVFGCEDTLKTRVTVFPEVVAQASANVVSGCAPLEVDFSNHSLRADNITWRFGDGSSSPEDTPRHTFHNYSDRDTTYTVVLTARSRYGCESQDTLHIHVKPYIETGFQVDPPVHCHPYPATFTNTSFGATTQRWSFDGGESYQEIYDTAFEHLFENTGDAPITYQVLLEGENAWGCQDTHEREITVYPLEESLFSADVVAGCAPLEVNFTNHSRQTSTYLWDFDNAEGTSSQYEPTVVFDNASTSESAFYTVELLTTSPWGCTDTSSVEIEVFPSLRAGFTFDYASHCTPTQVVFTNTSAGGVTHYWDFDDGSPVLESNDGSVAHTFVNTTGQQQTYRVRHWAENARGCVEEIVREVVIHPQVKADMEMISSGCHPLEVSFENKSLGAVRYFWEFEDGPSSQQASLTRVFTNTDNFTTKTYQVQLIAESEFGCRDTLVSQVEVHPKPRAGFSPSDAFGCAPLEVDFTHQSQGATLFTWTFGDGNPSITSPGHASHTYENTTNTEQTFTTELIVSNSWGCKDTLEKPVRVFPEIDAGFSVSHISGCHPLEVDITNHSTGASADTPYRWSYGDGNTSTTDADSHTHVFTNASHTQSQVYTLSLAAESAWGCKSDHTLQIEVYPKPRAGFTPDAAEGCSPHSVEFADASVGATAYLWDFADGNHSTWAGSETHRFQQAHDQGVGDYPVQLVVLNTHGCSDTINHSIRVFPDIVAEFTSQTQGCHPLEVDFANLSKGAREYSWSFDNGYNSNEQDFSYVFVNESFTDVRTYQVHLEAVSDYGCQASLTRDITVWPRPKSNFSLDKHHGCSPLEVNLGNQSEGGTLHRWNFGHGYQTNNALSFSHTFTNLQDEPLDIALELVTSNEYGCERTSVRELKVFPQVDADFTADIPAMAGCSPLSLNFENLSRRAHSYHWSFDDGTHSVSSHPSNTFYTHSDSEKYYQVNLHATSVYGCEDLVSKQVRVYPVPVADLFVSPHSQIYPNTTVEVENLSAPGQWTYLWNMGDGSSFTTHAKTPFEHTFVWGSGDYATRYYRVHLMVGNEFCFDSISQRVVVHAPYPVVGFEPAARGCPPLDVQFRNATQYGKEFLWDFDDGNFSSVENPRHIFEDPGQYLVKLLVSGEGGMDSAYQVITVFEPPVADFRPDKPVIQLPYESVQMINLSSLAATFEWHMGDGQVYYDFEPEHEYEAPGNYDITLIVGSDTNPVCYDQVTKSSAVVAEQPCQVIFPNAFTPNTYGPSGGRYVVNDPANHVFYPVHTGLKDYRLEIYNRWGEFLFRSTDVDIGWDGYYRGRLAPMDVYVWKVWATCFSGKKIEEAGDVTLYR